MNMKKLVIALTASTLMLAGSLSTLSAQPGGGPMMQDGQGRGPMMEAERPYRGDFGPGPMTDVDRRGRGHFRPEMMMGGGMSGYGMMMGAGMMGHGMMRMMLIVMDTDGDGALSLEEFQAVHERMFAAMDVDDDGKLTFEEMEGFMDSDRVSDDDDQ
jgi:hypothetical protein